MSLGNPSKLPIYANAELQRMREISYILRRTLLGVYCGVGSERRVSTVIMAQGTLFCWPTAGLFASF
jgi:hypothetical protein